MTRMDLFVAKTCLNHATGCIEWTGFLNKGYGWFWVPGGPVFAYRWIYEQLVEPLAEGRQVDHLCRNKACVNPDHLEAVSQTTNVLRGISPTAINARKTHCQHGHEFTPENTKLDVRGYRRCLTCRRIYRQQRRRAARALQNSKTAA